MQSIQRLGHIALKQYAGKSSKMLITSFKAMPLRFTSITAPSRFNVMGNYSAACFSSTQATTVTEDTDSEDEEENTPEAIAKRELQ